MLLGVDLGTSSVKALLVDADSGRVVGLGTATYPTLRPQNGYAEQEPQRWWRATVSAVREALSGVALRRDVAAVGISGQMHGTVLLGDSGEPLGPAIIWPDQRSAAQVVQITEAVGAERLIGLTGSPVATGFQAATARWMQQNQPELWERVEKILLPKDYLRFRLTGEFYTDPSDGSGTLLLDVRRRDWSPLLLETLDIQRGQLPPVQPSASPAGGLTAQAGKALGLEAGIPVMTGAADTACGALGAGVVSGRDILLTISTGGQIVLPSPSVRTDRCGRVHTFCSAVAPGKGQAGWYQMAAILSAGLALDWLRDRVLALEGAGAFAQMTEWASRVPAGARGILFLPYLVGERTPLMDPHARGVFLGLAAEHGRPELVRAVMEGVALAFYDGYHVLQELGAHPSRVIMAGGGARSAVWRQIVADVFGLPVQRLQVAEQSAMGAALLAGVGMGLFDPLEVAQRWAVYGPATGPEGGRHAQYGELLSIFRDAYRKHREDFTRLREVCDPSSDQGKMPA